MQVRQSLRDNLVFRMKAPAMSRERVRRMLDIYLMGRESSTLRSYQSSFRKIVQSKSMISQARWLSTLRMES
jgi:hypothetical protein